MPVPNRKMWSLDLPNVRIEHGFWGPRLRVNRNSSIPHIYAMCKKTGRIDALRLRWKSGQKNPPHFFWESDLAKWIEAASYTLSTHRDRRLEKRLDRIIALLAAAQQPDGYLNAYFTVIEPRKRWTNLRDCHELYCAGHLFEAGAAHFRATGKRTLLDVACRYADHINTLFGPGKRTGYPGHEEIELALVKLYRTTGRKRYLRLCEYFINARGRQPHFFDAEALARGERPPKHRHEPATLDYWQARLPVRQQDEAVGHAVRAVYLYSGMADLAAETGDESLLESCRRLWQSITARKLYITGAIGARHEGEAFGRDYELPNQSAYAETCAAIGLVFFAHRMLQIEADARYADVMERALYNGVLSAMGLGGTEYFYVNPLASAGNHHRQEFFACSCCPPNLARLLASLGAYIYGAADGALYVHLYVAGEAAASIGEHKVTITQQTDYPWDGSVAITLAMDTPAEFNLCLRVPGWCTRHRIKVNGKPVAARIRKGYATIRRRWSDGDRVTLAFAMPVERLVAHPAVADDAGRIAIARGPMVYCIEQCDHRADVRSILLPDKAPLAARYSGRTLAGCVVIEGAGLAPAASGWKGKPYRRAPDLAAPRPVKIRAIPYFLWDNRAPGPMTVWLPRG